MFHPEGYAHRDEITVADSRFFAVEIDPSLLGPRERDELGAVHDLRGGPAVWAMLRLLESAREPHDHLDCEEPVTEILDGLLAPLPTESPAWLVRIEAYCAITRARRSRCVRSPTWPACIRSTSPACSARVMAARCGRSSSASASSTRLV